MSDIPPHVTRHENAPEHETAAAHDWSDAELVGRTITIGRPRNEVYALFRDFSGFPRFMENIERVDVSGPRTSHWVVRAPEGAVEWDAEITEETPGEVIAWRSMASADVRHEGRVEFVDAPPGRGVQVRLTLAYEPPAGVAGKLVATLFQRDPQVQARRDLRRFKQLVETGEVATAYTRSAIPHGATH